MTVIRWIASFPLALLAGWLAYMVGGFINNVTTVVALGHIHGIERWYVDGLNNAFFGFGLVWAAVKIAPSAPKAVASVMTALSLMFAGGLLTLALLQGHPQAFPGIAGFVLGACAVCLSAWGDQVRPFLGWQAEAVEG